MSLYSELVAVVACPASQEVELRAPEVEKTHCSIQSSPFGCDGPLPFHCCCCSCCPFAEGGGGWRGASGVRRR